MLVKSMFHVYHAIGKKDALGVYLFLEEKVRSGWAPAVGSFYRAKVSQHLSQLLS